MAISYTSLGGTVTINPVGAVAPADLNTAVAIVGNYDSDNADSSVTAGEATSVNSSTEAETMFGADSELAYQTALAFLNGAGVVYGVPVEQTETTETFGDSTETATGTLSNTPIIDPRVSPSVEVTATDVTESASVTVNVVDADDPSTPTDSNTINLSYSTGDWEADDTSEYEITYSHGDVTAAIEAATTQTVRNVAICSENGSDATTADTELSNDAENGRYGRAIIGSEADLQASEISSYTPAVDSWRVVEVAPARASNSDGDVRTVGAVAGLLAQQPIDVTGSITYDGVSGFESLEVEYSPLEADDFERVTAITDEFEIAEGVTTASEDAFSDIYAVEIIDFVIEQLNARVKNFRGGSNSQEAKQLFGSRVTRALESMSAPSAQPPLLATGDGTQPYFVNVTEGANNTETDLTVGIEIAPIAKTVNLDLSVGPFQFNGATA